MLVYETCSVPPLYWRLSVASALEMRSASRTNMMFLASISLELSFLAVCLHLFYKIYFLFLNKISTQWYFNHYFRESPANLFSLLFIFHTATSQVAPCSCQINPKFRRRLWWRGNPDVLLSLMRWGFGKDKLRLGMSFILEMVLLKEWNLN